MDDLKLRLKYDDVNIRSRCIQKLLESIKRKIRGSVIDSLSVQIPELSLILEACHDDSPITCNLAVQAVIFLVTNKCMNSNYAIDKLLGCLKPSNYQSVINGISLLLMYEYSHASEKKVPKYSLLFPRHPLIAAVEEQEETVSFVVESVKKSLETDYDIGFKAMEPVILFLLCNPCHKQRVDYSKLLLLDVFLSSQKGLLESTSQIMKYVPFMQVESLFKVTEVSSALAKITKSLISLQDVNQNNSEFVQSLLLALFALAERCIAFGNDLSTVVQLLIQLSPLLPKTDNKSSNCVNICLILLSNLLKSSSGLLLIELIELGLSLLNSASASPTVAAVLATSVLHILPESSLTSTSDSLKLYLSKLLTKLETIYLPKENITSDLDAESTSVNPGDSFPLSDCKTFNLFETFTPSLETAAVCVKFIKILDESSSSFIVSWLNVMKMSANSTKTENLETIYSLAAALFLKSPDDELFLSSCLDTLESILHKNPHLSTRLFSILLYKLSLVNCPKSKLIVLNFLPKSAVHKYAVSPVLGILNLLAKEPELKPQAIYLMLQLWKKQERCFPHLHGLLTETNNPFNFDSGVNEVLISQATAILEVCNTEPEKHGHDFLNTLNTILNNCQDEANLPVACLAIDGIITLCKTEMIDIRSTCKALSPRLRKDKRTLVLCRMYQLLALIPDLKVKSCEYDKFMSDTVESIWKQISSGISDERVLCEAFKTLAKFPMDCHVLKQLPAAAKGNLKLPKSMKATPFEMGKNPEDVLTYIPGYCFTDLLLSLEGDVILEGYTYFLHSLVKMEVQELQSRDGSRSFYRMTKYVAKQKKQSDALSKVPEFLCTQFQAMKSPALQKNLAVGVLLCYEPPLETGKDGMPVKRSIASQYRSYEQVLAVLLKEVSIDTNDWHRSILISNAWGSFMERAFLACEEARRAELDLQVSHGHLDLTSEGLSSKSKTTWLWVRDRLVNLIKTNSKNTPTVHANAIFAISGLLAALEKFYNALDENTRTSSDESGEFTLHKTFISEYVETIICAMFPDYNSPGKVQSWLLTHLSRPNSSANYLVRGCASASICHIVSSLINQYSSELLSIVQIMVNNTNHSSPVLSFYSGLGLGLLVKSLCDAGFTDAEESLVNMILKSASDIIKIYDKNDGVLTSCLVALTLYVSSMSQSSDERIKDWIVSTCNLFYEKLMDEEKSSMQFEMLCICVTAMTISAVEGGCLPIHNLEDLASWLEMNRLESPQCSGISVSLGMQIEAYERLNHASGAEIKQKVSKSWFNTLTGEKRPTLQRIAALNGLNSLFSKGRGLVQVKTQPNAESMSMVNELITFMFQILAAPRDTGLQSICGWEIGRLFSVNSNDEQTDSSVSSSYSYLGEKSVLKPLMNIIADYQKEDSVAKYCHVLACMKALAEPLPRPLPPINWVTILTPFLQNNKDLEALGIALKIAVLQSKSSSYAANIIASYCTPPLIHTLPESCSKILLDNIPNLLLVLPAPKMQLFLQTIISQTIKKDDALESRRSVVLQGILDSLKQTGYKEQSKKVLQDAFFSIFRHFKKKEDYMDKYLLLISEMMTLLPENVLDSLLSVSANAEELPGTIKIWCYFVKTGKKPIKSLRPCLEEAKCCTIEQKEKICWCIFDCFLFGNQNSESEVNQTDKCISWLLETIGWIKVLEDSKSKYQLLTIGEVYIFLVDICIATIIGCSGLGNNYHLFSSHTLNQKMLLESLPLAVNKLCQKSGWNEVTDKIIDWLIMMLKSQYLQDIDIYYVKLSLLLLRSTEIFEKKDVWTEICNLICK